MSRSVTPVSTLWSRTYSAYLALARTPDAKRSTKPSASVPVAAGPPGSRLPSVMASSSASGTAGRTVTTEPMPRQPVAASARATSVPSLANAASSTTSRRSP